MRTMLRALERAVDAYLGSADPELNAVVQQIRDLVPACVKRLGEVCWLETQSHQSAAANGWATPCPKVAGPGAVPTTMRASSDTVMRTWVGVQLVRTVPSQ